MQTLMDGKVCNSDKFGQEQMTRKKKKKKKDSYTWVPLECQIFRAWPTMPFLPIILLDYS